MILTKFNHACFTLTVDGQTLVIDPGEFTDDFTLPESVVGVIITHQHPDHYDPRLLATICEAFPVSVYTTDDVAITNDHIDKVTVSSGTSVTIGPFLVEFFGGQHASIDTSVTPVDNIGILVNKSVYYPGDSFALPNKHVAVLALPVSAPWLKLSESLDFLRAVRPGLTFPTHDAILSDAGKSIVDRLVSSVAQENGTTYQRLVHPLDIEC